MKHYKKKILIALVIILILWISVIIIDAYRFYEYKNPIFAIQITDNYYEEEYIGLGYNIQIEKSITGLGGSGKFCIFGISWLMWIS